MADYSTAKYSPESREAAEHRDPRELLAEVAAILGDVEALAAEWGAPAA